MFWLRYVPHDRAADYAALGWMDANGFRKLGSHGQWAVLMRFEGAAPPPEIEDASAAANS